MDHDHAAPYTAAAVPVVPLVPDQGLVRTRLEAAQNLPEEHRRRELAEVIADHLPFARRLGRSMAPNPALREDCEQVACVGLVLAVQRWDPRHEATLSTFAHPTILGELRRFLRDSTWWVRPPRRLQELAIELRRAEEELRHDLGVEPDAEELATRLGVTPQDVTEARWATAGRFPQHVEPQDHGRMEQGAPTTPSADEWVSLHPHIQALDPRDRCVLLRRYLEDETQEVIASALGISQAQVSRRLARALSTLREQAGRA